MNPELEKELEAEISSALRGLPELAAPPGLLARTMSAIERSAVRAGLWNQWPVPLRVGFIVAGFSVLVGAVFGWRAIGPGLFAAAWRDVAPAISSAQCAWSVLAALTGAAALAAGHLGKLFILVCVLAAVTASAFFGGFSTVLMRLALGRPRNSKL
jgi:hypothetical protein